MVTTGRDRAVVTPVRRDTGGQSAPEPSTPHAHVATFLHLRHLPASGAPALVRAKTPPSRAMTQRQIQERKSLYEGQGQSSKTLAKGLKDIKKPGVGGLLALTGKGDMWPEAEGGVWEHVPWGLGDSRPGPVPSASAAASVTCS